MCILNYLSHETFSLITGKLNLLSSIKTMSASVLTCLEEITFSSLTQSTLLVLLKKNYTY